MKEIIEQSLEAIHTHTHTHTHTSNFIEEINILPYVLFGMYIRDG